MSNVLGRLAYGPVPAGLGGPVTSADTLGAYGAVPLGSLGIGWNLLSRPR